MATDWKSKYKVLKTVEEMQAELERSTDAAKREAIVKEMLLTVDARRGCSWDEFEVACAVMFDETRERWPATQEVCEGRPERVGASARQIAWWAAHPQDPGVQPRALSVDEALYEVEKRAAEFRHDNVSDDMRSSARSVSLWTPPTGIVKP